MAIVLLGLSCAGDDATHHSEATAAGAIPAPSPNDPVTEWELQYLPAIDAHMHAGRLDSVVIVCQLGLEGDSTRILLYNLMASAYATQGRYGPPRKHCRQRCGWRRSLPSVG